MDPNKVEKQSTVGSGIWLLVLIAVFIAAIVLVVLNPSVLESIAIVIGLILLAIVVIAVIIAIFAGLISIPMYMKRGVQVQTDYSYNLDDVKEVDGSMENREEKKD